MAKRKKNSLKQSWEKLPPILRGRFAVATLVFLAFILYLDRRNVFSQLKLRNSIIRYEDKRDQLKEDIEAAELERLNMDQQRERFARETYFMQQDDEDVFIIVEEEEPQE
ncbi:MAG: hypothetical protein AAF741_10020 [Bacteroidota bacterium]